jgi:hypothetical protein
MTDLGRHYGIDVIFIPADRLGPPLPLSGSGCPTVLWIEHASYLDGARTAKVAGLLPENGSAESIKTTVTRTGTVIVRNPPAR